MRFNYFSEALLPGIIGMSVALTACSNHDKPVVEGPVRVDVEIVKDTNSASSGQDYSGTVESAEASTVSFSVPGTITKIYVKEGQKVTKGQLLAQIKSDNLINSRNIAQAELEEAKDAYQRLKKLHDANALPEIKWVEVQAKLKQAQNAAALADRAVGDASLHSPIDGYISRKFVNDGQTVIPAAPVVEIMDLNNLRVAISVPENEISSFGSDITASISFGEEDSIKVTGIVGQKGVSADPLTRSYVVKFDIKNVEGKILPGMIGTVAVDGLEQNGGVVSEKTQSVTLPSKAVLLSADNRQFVWTVKDGKAQRKFVTADELSADGVIVKSGLAAGDSVIVAGMQKVSSGTSVTATR